MRQDTRRRREEEADGRKAVLRKPRDHSRDFHARLLDAQESERSRIARELHDDIGQQLAVLAMNLRLSGNDDDALRHIERIATSVREMSHRLHPAMLQLVGLVDSVRSLQREQCRSGVAIAFTHQGVPGNLPPAVTLCFFRVIQEALQNAIRHGQARRVSIDVRRVDDHLTLTIVDDGRGFDVESACGTGLGLISLIERVEASGGKVVIRSQQGFGTEIAARVPLRGQDGLDQVIGSAAMRPPEYDADTADTAQIRRSNYADRPRRQRG